MYHYSGTWTSFENPYSFGFFFSLFRLCQYACIPLDCAVKSRASAGTSLNLTSSDHLDHDVRAGLQLDQHRLAPAAGNEQPALRERTRREEARTRQRTRCTPSHPITLPSTKLQGEATTQLCHTHRNGNKLCSREKAESE